MKILQFRKTKIFNKMLNIFLYILSFSFLLKILLPLVIITAIGYFVLLAEGVDPNSVLTVITETIDKIKNFF